MPLSHASEVSYSYLFPLLLIIPNHILIYFLCSHIFSNNFYSLIFWLLLFFADFNLLLFHHLFDYLVIIFSLNTSKLSQSICSNFPDYIPYSYISSCLSIPNAIQSSDIIHPPYNSHFNNFHFYFMSNTQIHTSLLTLQ